MTTMRLPGTTTQRVNPNHPVLHAFSKAHPGDRIIVPTERLDRPNTAPDSGFIPPSHAAAHVEHDVLGGTHRVDPRRRPAAVMMAATTAGDVIHGRVSVTRPLGDGVTILDTDHQTVHAIPLLHTDAEGTQIWEANLRIADTTNDKRMIIARDASGNWTVAKHNLVTDSRSDSSTSAHVNRWVTQLNENDVIIYIDTNYSDDKPDNNRKGYNHAPFLVRKVHGDSGDVLYVRHISKKQAADLAAGTIEVRSLIDLNEPRELSREELDLQALRAALALNGIKDSGKIASILDSLKISRVLFGLGFEESDFERIMVDFDLCENPGKLALFEKAVKAHGKDLDDRLFSESLSAKDPVKEYGVRQRLKDLGITDAALRSQLITSFDLVENPGSMAQIVQLSLANSGSLDVEIVRDCLADGQLDRYTQRVHLKAAGINTASERAAILDGFGIPANDSGEIPLADAIVAYRAMGNSVDTDAVANATILGSITEHAGWIHTFNANNMTADRDLFVGAFILADSIENEASKGVAIDVIKFSAQHFVQLDESRRGIIRSIVSEFTEGKKEITAATAQAMKFIIGPQPR